MRYCTEFSSCSPTLSPPSIQCSPGSRSKCYQLRRPFFAEELIVVLDEVRITPYSLYVACVCVPDKWTLSRSFRTELPGRDQAAFMRHAG